MEDLSEFVASVVEFLVGGVLFTIAVIILVSGIIKGMPPLSDAQARMLSPESALFTALFLAIAYAMGVVAEHIARGLFEVLLDRITVRRKEFLDPSSVIGKGGDGEKMPAWRNRPTQFFLGGYTIDQRNEARAERERQRAKVMTFHLSLHEEIQSQLKRLRLERVFTLSLAVVAVSLLLRGDIKYAVIATAFTGVLVWVVHDRLAWYCGAIVRYYKMVAEDNLTQTSSKVETGGSIS